MLCHLRTPAIKKSDNPPCQIQLLKKIADKLSDKKEESLKAAIGALAQEKYKQPAKPLQIEAVYNLACGRNTFLLAGTGFETSRISEIYHTLLPKNSKGVILVLNPLDTLGNNQVLEKKNADFTAINLTKSNFKKEANDGLSPPIAIEGIKKSLKLEPHNLTIVQGELTRPKIQIICVHITESMALCGHLLLWYTQLNVACYEGTGFGSWNSGEFDETQINAWAKTGLVYGVIQMGCTDPSSTCQMIGWCGRDGQPGPAIIYAEPKRRGGKNSVDDFLPNVPQTNEDQMEVLVITPVCLQIAFALDNLLGYIPLSMDNPNYKREQECEKNAGFAACMCSNCTPAEGLMSRIKTMDIHNMEEMILRYWPAPAPLVTTTKRKRATGGNGGTSATRKEKKTQLAASKNLV
ncbi:hypothetical protein PSTG_15166 [Puccinia striiformis f. sp. tritici PST-78]|uniref:DNA 3'-5' helicase n=1 Tax=Puccinia striiformis f. sp. tritici PST-78 TaxID=1165861 RepID=A0A0L0UXF8_9BASI|nr:hypothetical protein PSTG_15166 [Puccinia striiformis f. sp. tritici PST-78]